MAHHFEYWTFSEPYKINLFLVQPFIALGRGVCFNSPQSPGWCLIGSLKSCWKAEVNYNNSCESITKVGGHEIYNYLMIFLQKIINSPLRMADMRWLHNWKFLCFQAPTDPGYLVLYDFIKTLTNVLSVQSKTAFPCRFLQTIIRGLLWQF